MNCVFCESSGKDENLGEFRQASPKTCSLQFHSNCLLYNSEIRKNSDRTEGHNQFEGEDVANALEKARYQICTFCKKGNASIQCNKSDCETRFHLPCALMSKRSLHLHSGAFESFCHEHIPFECIFDGEPITGLVTPVPCCEKVYSHDQCLKKYAAEARTESKCSLCSNVNEFRSHIQTDLQFDIPDGTPSYDVADDVEGVFECAAFICKSTSRLGRSLHMEGTAFHLIQCLYCGSDAIHRICGQGRIGQNDEWTCESCTTTEVIELNNGAKRLKMSEQKSTFGLPFVIRLPGLPRQRRTFGSSFEIRVPRIPSNDTETQN